MTTGLIILGVVLVAVIFLRMFAVANRRQGEADIKNEMYEGEIETAKKANKIEADSRNDSRDDTISGL